MEPMDLSTLDLDLDPIWHSLGSGALIAGALTLVRLGLEYAIRRGERRLDHEDRRRAYQRDAEARLERVLQDRLCEADRRLERCELEIESERGRRVAVERDYAVLCSAYEVLKEQCAALHAEQAASLGQRRRLNEELHAAPEQAALPTAEVSRTP
jgi:hypothetical protein